MDEKPAMRRSIFAVWRWSWMAWAVIPLLPVMYLFSVPILEFASLMAGPQYAWVFALWLDPYSAPAWWCEEKSAVITAVWQFENEALNWAFGYPY